MTVSFSYDKKKVIQALRYHFLTRPEIRILLILINVFAIGSAILLYFRIIQPLSFLIFSFLWFALMLVVWRILPVSIYKKSQTFQDNFSMDFEEEYIVLRTQRGEKRWPWEAFSKFVESPYFFHLYFDPRSFFLVPTDAFNTVEERQEVRNLLKSRINGS
ncbi:MAG: YcxB family protein [Chitinophagaceae bacterium]|nr:YcxB family protein [Chitinophagaceae bacterium]